MTNPTIKMLLFKVVHAKTGIVQTASRSPQERQKSNHGQRRPFKINIRYSCWRRCSTYTCQWFCSSRHCPIECRVIILSCTLDTSRICGYIWIEIIISIRIVDASCETSDCVWKRAVGFQMIVIERIRWICMSLTSIQIRRSNTVISIRSIQRNAIHHDRKQGRMRWSRGIGKDDVIVRLLVVMTTKLNQEQWLLSIGNICMSPHNVKCISFWNERILIFSIRVSIKHNAIDSHS